MAKSDLDIDAAVAEAFGNKSAPKPAQPKQAQPAPKPAGESPEAALRRMGVTTFPPPMPTQPTAVPAPPKADAGIIDLGSIDKAVADATRGTTPTQGQTPTTQAQQPTGVKGKVDQFLRRVQEAPSETAEALARPFKQIYGVAEAGTSLLTGATTGVLGGAGGLIKGVGESIASGTFGSQKGARQAVAEAAKGMEALTYSPRTEAGQALVKGAGELAGEYLPPILPVIGAPGQVAAGTRAAASRIAAPAERALTAAEREAGYVAGAAKQAGQAATKAAAAVTPAPVRAAVAKVAEAVAPSVTTPAQAAAKVAEKRAAREAAKAAATSEVPGAELRRYAAQAPTEPVARPKPAPTDKFSELNYTEKGLPLNQQIERAETLSRVLGEDYPIDMSVIEGKGTARATKYATSKLDTPEGYFHKEQIQAEQAGLQKYLDEQIKNTGATPGVDQSAKLTSGENFLSPLEGLTKYFDNATSKLYQDRHDYAQNIPVVHEKLVKTLRDDTINQANIETIGLRKQALAKMREFGLMDKDGNLLPTDAKRSEAFRQYLNTQYQPKNTGFHQALKQAVDDDVLANIPETSPIYQDARNLYKLKKDTLDNPNGIAKILDASGPNNINRKVPAEAIVETVVGMPVAQFDHIITTLRGVPEHLQPAAQKAIGELKGAFIKKIQDANTPKKLTQFFNGKSEVMNRLFSPEEIKELRDYHDAVHILKTDTGYPGAAVQAINLRKPLVRAVGEEVLATGAGLAAEAATKGSTLGGAALLARGAVKGKFEKRQAAKQAEAEAKRFQEMQATFVPLREILPKRTTGGSTPREIMERGQ